MLFEEEPELLHIARCSEEGCAEKEISRKTGLALYTVKNKRKRLLKLLHVKNMLEAKIDLIKHGLLVQVTTKPFTPDAEPYQLLKEYITELQDKKKNEEWEKRKKRLGYQ